jgi:type IV pilus assembly protein PilV
MKMRLLSRQRQKGFSLIEVLVSVVIMSVGILGVAGLQVLSLQQNRSSLFRSEALMLGGDILDRMRANPLQNYAGFDFLDPPPPSASNCVADSCTAAQMKDFDIAWWRCSINHLDASNNPFEICGTLGVTGSSLPGGQGEIADIGDETNCSVEAGESCVIVQWVESQSKNPTNSSVTLRARIN